MDLRKNSKIQDPISQGGWQSDTGASLALTMVLAGAITAGVFGLQQYTAQKSEIRNRDLTQYRLETANESAIALASQLLGNSSIFVSGNSFALNPNAGKPDASNWTVTSGALRVSTCLRPSGQNLASIFSNQSDPSFVRSCDPKALASTDIKVNRQMAISFENFKNESQSQYVLVDTMTSLGQQSLKKQARVRQAETTKVCNFNDPNTAEACKVDHCRFMKPLRDANFNAVYGPDGKIDIQVNELYSEKMRLTTSSAQVSMTKINNNTPFPIDTYNFFNNAYKRGRIDPFKAIQSINPVEVTKPFVTVEPDGSVWLEVNNIVNKGDNSIPPGVPIFDGFLRYNYAKGLSDAIPWPPGQPYRTLATDFKNGCSRTIGNSAPDLCSRINVNIKQLSYAYTKRRRCFYEGPQNYPSFIARGLRSWDKIDSTSFEDEGPWKPSQEDKASVKIESDTREPWVDNAPHHDFGPSPGLALHQWYPHFDEDLKVGRVRVKEVAERPRNSDKFEERINTYNWRARCVEYKPTASDVFNNDVTVCFYLTYYNIQDRLSCRMAVSDYVCRNLNGCFAEGTKILMADGSEREIEKVQQGDFVLNPATRQPTQVRKVIVGEENRELYEVSYASQKVRLTGTHPLVTPTGLKTVVELQAGDLIADDKLAFIPIQGIKKLTPEKGTLVWNLVVSDGENQDNFNFDRHLFVAGHLASGDYFLQQGASFLKKEYEDFTRFLVQKRSASLPHHPR